MSTPDENNEVCPVCGGPEPCSHDFDNIKWPSASANTERAYRWVKDIVDQLPSTKQRELRWAEIRPEPPRHMNLALDPRPRHFGRLCRFRVGDVVKVVYQTERKEVIAVECPEVNPPGWSHCSGSDAIYTLSDGSRVGDIELSFAYLDERYPTLPSGRTVCVISHEHRLISLTDVWHKPLDAGDLLLDDWYALFHTFVSTKT